MSRVLKSVTISILAYLVLSNFDVSAFSVEMQNQGSVTMQLTSSAFQEQGSIPKKYTCDGENISPPLSIRNVPPHAQSLVLFVEDPDVPSSIRNDGLWVHWVVYNIPPTTQEINEGQEVIAMHGVGTGGDTSYEGPCPPDKMHHYHFKLYALDARLSLPENATKQEVEQAMEKHVIAKVELVATYKRK